MHTFITEKICNDIKRVKLTGILELNDINKFKKIKAVMLR